MSVFTQLLFVNNNKKQLEIFNLREFPTMASSHLIVFIARQFNHTEPIDICTPHFAYMRALRNLAGALSAYSISFAPVAGRRK